MESKVLDVYSDRLWEWDPEKFGDCHEKVFGTRGQGFNRKDTEGISRFLSLYFGENVRVIRVFEEVNAFNGYPYWRFCYVKE